jgi:hypothetical protein
MQRLQLDLVPGLAHGWSSQQNAEALRSSIAAWFHSYLPAKGKTESKESADQRSSQQ